MDDKYFSSQEFEQILLGRVTLHPTALKCFLNGYVHMNLHNQGLALDYLVAIDAEDVASSLVRHEHSAAGLEFRNRINQPATE